MSENTGWWTLPRRVLIQLWDKWPKCLSEKRNPDRNQLKSPELTNPKFQTRSLEVTECRSFKIWFPPLAAVVSRRRLGGRNHFWDECLFVQLFFFSCTGGSVKRKIMLKRTIFRIIISRVSHRQRRRFTSMVEAFAIGSFQRLVRVNVLIEVEMLSKHSMYMKSECGIALFNQSCQQLVFRWKKTHKRALIVFVQRPPPFFLRWDRVVREKCVPTFLCSFLKFLHSSQYHSFIVFAQI